MNDAIDSLVAAVGASPKYRYISPDLVRTIGAIELTKRGSLKEATKATKNLLHQVAGAYYAERPPYARWLQTLQQAHTSSSLPTACLPILAAHASTKERTPLLSTFYPQLFAGLPPVTRLLDLACGLNPLTIPWMPLASSATYIAYDLYSDLADFLASSLPLLGVQGEAGVCDLSQTVPTTQVDIAFLFKVLPCLHLLDPGAGIDLLKKIESPVLLVSFPVASLGGRNRGMSQNYAAMFERLIAAQSWRCEMFAFPTELVFRLRK